MPSFVRDGPGPGLVQWKQSRRAGVRPFSPSVESRARRGTSLRRQHGEPVATRQNGAMPRRHTSRTTPARARDDSRPPGVGAHSRRDGTAKTPYMSRGEALSVADERLHEAGVQLDVYCCGVCGAWHLGKPFGADD